MGYMCVCVYRHGHLDARMFTVALVTRPYEAI